MVILDTDVLTLIQRKSGAEYRRLAERIAPVEDHVYTTIVTVDEQFRGWLAFAAKAKTPEQYAGASVRLRQLLDFFLNRRILDFDPGAVLKFKELKAAKIRISTMDLRIASVALAHDATLVTRNLSDYRQVPGLRAEDWTAPAAAEGEK